MAAIYVLRCPINDAVRYVGKAINTARRLNGHIKEANGGAQHYRARWIRSLLKQGLNPVLEVVYEIQADEDWKLVERRFIARYRADGHRLTNMTAGGEGWADMHPEVRARMAASVKAVFSTPERREIARQRALANASNPIIKARHRAGRIAYLSAPEVRLKMSVDAKAQAARHGALDAMSSAAKAAWKLKKADQAALEGLSSKTSASMKALWADPEVKANRLLTLHAPDVKARRYATREAPERKALRSEKLKAAWVLRKARASM